ncbi:Peroxin/Dysferlin domain-containing protein [Chaetomium fimeti]|uniref:Peroxin/Dysferlin domain-containing protein n=1 Tax=Chaetomium fimeti TaxID=1854472 RepID=A0AAE0HRL1_9PEZI|nr:Peroxin/Dysferlin domain-containing protein [Chaetomium fimeti]
MEDYATSFLNVIEEAAIPESESREDDGQHELDTVDAADAADTADPESAKKRRGLRSGIFRAANIQDKLLEKLVSQVIPAEEGHGRVPDVTGDDIPFAKRPGFSLPLMTTNFRRFNARIGVVFKFQARAFRLLSWRRPTHTLSFLAVYTFVCLDPYLLFALPLAISLFGILVPSFIARHPAPTPDADRVRNMSYSPRGPPLAPARTVKPTKELSHDFFRNMGDLQNVMEDFSVAHDKIVALVVPKTNFSDEALSSAVFVLLFAGCLLMLIAAHLLPLRALALVGGWAAIWSSHPTVARLLQRAKLQYLEPPPSPSPAADPLQQQQQQQQEPTTKPTTPQPNPPKQQHPLLTHPTQTLQTLITQDILLDTSPETREVEIFELQHQPHPPPPPPPTATPTTVQRGEWEPWLFSPSPYDPLSAARLANERPRGARFFEDVLPPRGWVWSEKKWALDLWSREWVEERIITGVEVETEGERWVYDMWSERDAARGGGIGGSGGGGEGEDGVVVRDGQGRGAGTGTGTGTPGVSWEEGEEGMGRRGQWRRRRWVRLVKRKGVAVSG